METLYLHKDSAFNAIQHVYHVLDPITIIVLHVIQVNTLKNINVSIIVRTFIILILNKLSVLDVQQNVNHAFLQHHSDASHAKLH
jgi:Na+/H+ antiporter NhaC